VIEAVELAAANQEIRGPVVGLLTGAVMHFLHRVEQPAQADTRHEPVHIIPSGVSGVVRFRGVT
jgi:hypothetical protein